MFTTPAQREIAHLRHHLHAHTQPDSGLLYFKAIQQCRLDGTVSSLERLDKLLDQMCQKGMAPDVIRQKPGGKNLLLTIAIYIVDCIGTKIDDVPIWYNRIGATEYMQEEPPKQFAFSIMAQFSYGVSLPLGPIEAALTDGYSIKDYVNITSSDILAKSRVNLNEAPSVICKRYLKKVRTGKLIDTTIAYHQQLSQVTFDYSQQSLKQIDVFLAYVKSDYTKRGLDYTSFLRHSDNQALLLLLGYYIGMCASVLARTMVKWFSFQQINDMQTYAEIEASFENQTIMMFSNGQLRSPFLALTNYLFDLTTDTYQGAQQFANTIVKEHGDNLSSYSLYGQSSTTRNNDTTFINTPQPILPQDWETATTLAGQLLAMNLVHVSDGGYVPPMSIKQQGAGITIVNHILEDDSGLDRLLSELDIPDLDAPFNMLSYDMYLNLPTGRTDGIVIEVRVTSEPTLTLQFMLPYRHAKDTLGFAIYPIINCQINNRPAEWLTALASSLYKGAKGVSDPILKTDFWSTYYIDKHDLYEPAPPIKRAVAVPFDQSQSEITIYSSGVKAGGENEMDAVSESATANSYRNTTNSHIQSKDDGLSLQKKKVASNEPVASMYDDAEQHRHLKELLSQDKYAVMSRVQEGSRSERDNNNWMFYVIVVAFIALLRMIFN